MLLVVSDKALTNKANATKLHVINDKKFVKYIKFSALYENRSFPI